MTEHRKTAVVDLDGTLSEYDKWRGEDHFGEPIPLARDALSELREWGWRIVVFTTRGNVPLVRDWLTEHRIPFDSVNSTDHNPPGTSCKPIADVYFDDRDAHVIGKRPYNWVKAMKRVRKLYQPKLDTQIDDAQAWAMWPARFWRWWSEFTTPDPMLWEMERQRGW